MPSNSPTTELTVVIPARNDEKVISSTLGALYDSRLLSGQDFRVAVCANACTDQTLAVLEGLKARHKNLDVITEWVPGKPKALNALVEHAEETRRLGQQDVVVFLDSKATVEPTTMAELSMALNKNKRLKAVSANDLASPPASASLLDHLLFGMSEASLSAIALQDRKASCTAVRGTSVRGLRFPEHVISDDLWLAFHLGMDSVDTHPEATVSVPRAKNFMEFASARVQHMMGLYQLEEFFDSTHVREHIPMGTHEHAQAFLEEAELQDQFMQLPLVYKAANVIAWPVHAALKAVAWVGYRMMPMEKQNSVSIRAPVESPIRRPADKIRPSESPSGL